MHFTLFKMKDLKYLLAYTIPLATFVALFYKGIFAYTTVVYAFGFIPILELLLKTKTENYKTAEVDQRLSNRLFDWMLYLNIPIVFALLIYGLMVLNTQSLSNFELVGLLFSLGILLSTNGINVAHELGHRQSRMEKTMSKLLLLPSLYMHFFIEHNYGHHKNVATKEDPATAKKNQALYVFWITSVVGQYRNAWRIQRQFLQRENASFFSIKNDLLFYLLFQGLYLVVIYLVFGTTGALAAIVIATVSFLLLETINYIEHYGLVRKMTNGRYERVKPIHSWNSDHVVGRIILYELTRHSDHHYRASKKYQVLESKEESPKLPFGYPSSMLIALIPPLWFSLMDKHLT